MVDLVIRNGKLVSPGGITRAGVAIDKGKIVAVATDANLPKAKRTIDAEGNYIMPGVVDPHTHPGGEGIGFKASCERETASAASAGITTIFGIQASMRIGGSPMKAVTTPEDVVSFHDTFPRSKTEVLDKSLIIDFGWSWALLSDQQATEIPEYAEQYGVTSFKFMLSYRKPTAWTVLIGVPVGVDDGLVYLAFESIGKLGPPARMFLHCENWEYARIFEERLKKAGRKDLAAYGERAPSFTEVDHIIRYAYLSKITNCPLYIHHLSSRDAMEAVVKAKAEGVDIVGETCPHYLTIDSEDDPPGILAKDNPTIKHGQTESLWEGVRDGSIQCMGTDHVPSRSLEWRFPDPKVRDDVWQFHAGFPGVETLLPLMLSEGVNKGRISFERLVEVCCQNPAYYMGVYPKKGTISVGSDGDVTIVDLNKTKKITAKELYTISDYTVYEGREVKGWPTLTVLRGNVVYENGKVVGKPGVGQYLPRKLGSQLYPLD